MASSHFMTSGHAGKPFASSVRFWWLSHAHLKPETLAKAAEARPERGALPDCAALRLANGRCPSSPKHTQTLENTRHPCCLTRVIQTDARATHKGREVLLQS